MVLEKIIGSATELVNIQVVMVITSGDYVFIRSEKTSFKGKEVECFNEELFAKRRDAQILAISGY